MFSLTHGLLWAMTAEIRVCFRFGAVPGDGSSALTTREKNLTPVSTHVRMPHTVKKPNTDLLASRRL